MYGALLHYRGFTYNMHMGKLMIIYYLQFNQHNVYTNLGRELLLLRLDDIVENDETYGSIHCLGDL